MNITLRSIGILGILLFGTLLAVTFLSPETIEESAEGFIKIQLEKEVKSKYEASLNSDVSNKALEISESLGFEKERIQANLDNNLPELIASVIASMCGYDCEKKKNLTQSIAENYLDRIANIEIAQ